MVYRAIIVCLLFFYITVHAALALTLEWNPNAETDIAGYRVYRGVSTGDYSDMVDVGNTTIATIPNLISGNTYYFVVTAYNTSGLEGPPSSEISAFLSESQQSGLKGYYFDDPNLTNLVLTRVDPTVDFYWEKTSPDPALPPDDFSVRWTGSLEPLYSETYTLHTISDDGVRLWVDGELLIDNWTVHAPTENMGTITLIAGQKYDIVMEYYERGWGAVAQLLWSSASQAKEVIPESALTSYLSSEVPPVANEAPIAIDDSVSIDEGFSATISVLANDSDPDDGPATLSIQSVSSAANGTTSVVGDDVIYTPNPGFFGIDTFSYAITDGDLSASATVTVTVQSTAKANNLAGSGLTGTSIGLVSGGSRVQFDDSWELTADGNGVAGIADNVYFEHAPRNGDFQAYVRIQSLTSSGAAPEVGLMLRDGIEPDARFAMLAATPNGFSYGSRIIAGGTASKTAVEEPTQFPDVWLLIERKGDSIDFATSTDGINFDPLGNTVMASLPDEVSFGLFVSSGTAGVSARAVVTDFTIIENTSESQQSGLKGYYFDDPNLTNLVLTRVDPTVDFYWEKTSPDPALPPDDFSVRWTGSLEPLYSETYTLHTISDDGVRLWVDGELLIDNWTVHAPTENMGTITLIAGQKYDIVMEYYERGWGAVAQLLWSSASQAKEVIPESALSTEP